MLAAAGISEKEIRGLHKDGAITRVLHGIYVVGADSITLTQGRRIAQLAAGPLAELSGRTSAEQRRLLPETDHPFEATVFGRRSTKRRTAKVSVEGSELLAAFVTRGSRWETKPELVRGVPCARTARTLLALAAREGGQIAHAAWREADFLGQLDPDEARAQCRSGVEGSGTLRRLADTAPSVRAPGTAPATTAEQLLIEALIRRGLPRPLSNAPMQLDDSWYFPDLWFVLWKLVIEVDGGAHYSDARRAADHLRDAHMRRHGISVLRADRDETLRDVETVADQAIAWIRTHGIQLPGR